MPTIQKTIEHYERLGVSVNGNPRFRFTFTERRQLLLRRGEPGDARGLDRRPGADARRTHPPHARGEPCLTSRPP
jgi:hypothetical protein